jgi:hypothetical protein
MYIADRKFWSDYFPRGPGQSKIYRLKCEFYKLINCKFYRLKCKIYKLKCKFYRLKCKFYRLKFKIYRLKCKFYRLKCALVLYREYEFVYTCFLTRQLIELDGKVAVLFIKAHLSHIYLLYGSVLGNFTD